MYSSIGAGDAFLGGLVAGIFYDGIPTNKAHLHRLGIVGSY